ncbi:MAG: hypothetical protein U0174_27190 [Polyangiaceae bacterium]
MPEVSTLQAAGGGAFLLAFAALVSLSLATWSLRKSRTSPVEPKAFGTALGAVAALAVMTALALAAYAATQEGARRWIMSEHATEQLSEMVSRAELQLLRGRAMLKVATALLWVPLVAAVVALWRAGIRDRGWPHRLTSLGAFASLAWGTIKLLSAIFAPFTGHEGRDMAQPIIIADMRVELLPAMNEGTCRRLEAAAVVVGPPKLASDVPSATTAARTCLTARLQSGVDRATLRRSPLLALAPDTLD